MKTPRTLGTAPSPLGTTPKERTGVETITKRGRLFHITFPERGNIREHIRRVLSGKEYPLLAPRLFQPDCVVDIGANVGASAVHFALYYPNAEVFCFEPSPSTVRYLSANAKPLANVQVFNSGLSDRSGCLKLFAGKEHCLQNSLFRGWGVGSAFEGVKVRRAATVLRSLVHGRCLLKLDCEGSEVPILRNLRAMMGAIDLLYVEYHSEDDRLAIDTLLASQFKLWRSKARMVHRGNLAFLSNSFLAQQPQLGQREIERPRKELGQSAGRRLELT